MGLHGKGDIVECGEIRKQRCDLKRPRETELAPPICRNRCDFLAVKTDAATIGCDFSRQLSNQGRLARAVRANNGMQFAGRNRKRNSVGRNHAPEPFGQGFNFEKDLTHGVAP